MMDAADWIVVEQLQTGIPLCPRPFAELAANVGMTEAEFIERVGRLHSEGVVRRIGPRLRHHRVGIRGNVLVVWRVCDERVAEVAQRFAAEEHVSHCYERPPFDGFPYNLYTMVHAPDIPAAERIIARMSSESDVTDYLLLPTVRELKKTSPVYHRPKGDENDHS